MKWLQRLLRGPTYVVVYDTVVEDEPDDENSTMDEQYYGYFSSPQEARMIFSEFSQYPTKTIRNVKLCKITQEWPDVNPQLKDPQ